MLREAVVADDSRVFRALVTEVLREKGFVVKEVGNGREALDYALSSRPKLLVVDALMPVLSGFEVVGRMREKAPDFHPVVIMVTGVYKSRRWESEARTRYRVDEYLEKPLSPETLLAALGRHFPDLDGS